DAIPDLQVALTQHDLTRQVEYADPFNNSLFDIHHRLLIAFLKSVKLSQGDGLVKEDTLDYTWRDTGRCTGWVCGQWDAIDQSRKLNLGDAVQNALLAIPHSR